MNRELEDDLHNSGLFEKNDKYYDFDSDDDSTIEAEIIDDNFDDVLTLTNENDNRSVGQYTGGGSLALAEYDDVPVVNININTQKIAKRYIQSVTKFVLSLSDVELGEEHKNYLKQVGQLKVDQLSDLLSMTKMNKMIIDNMVRNINANQGEDFAMIATYNNLINQHIKLHKELSLVYKNIPIDMRKMRNDVLDSNLLENKNGDDIPDDIANIGGNAKEQLRQLQAEIAQESGNQQ